MRTAWARAVPQFAVGSLLAGALLVEPAVRATAADPAVLAPGTAGAKGPGLPPRAKSDPALAPVDDAALGVQLLSRRLLASSSAADPGWYRADFDDARWSAAPRANVVPSRTAASGVSSAVPDADAANGVLVPPSGSLYFRLRFDVPDAPRAQSLELSLLYRDGFVAYLNGVEVARRNLPPATTPPTPPSLSRASAASGFGFFDRAGPERPPVPHGGEPEHIYIPLSSSATWRLRPTNNLLAVHVVPAATRAPSDPGAPAAHIELAAYSRPRLVRGPYLIAPSERGVSVAWETDLPTRGAVWLEPVGDPGVVRLPRRRISLGAEAPRRRQVVRLPDLVPGLRYRYRVEIDAVAGGSATARDATNPRRPVDRSSEAEFQAAPSARDVARFVVYGDMRAPGHVAHAAVVAGILRERPPLVLNTGDLVAAGGEESAWQRYFEITAALGATTPIVPALGNHESYLDGAAKSWSLFGLKSASALPATGYTSLDWGGLHFVILDTNDVDAEQRAWLGRDLAAARRRGVRAIFAVCHDGPWAHGIHGGSRAMEEEIAPVLVDGGVDVLFAGHDHLYERGTGVVAGRPRLPYVISGGGGAPLYNPSCTPAAAARSGAAAPSGALPACPPYVAIIQKAYHYVAVEVDSTHIRLCPRAPDGSELEPCVAIPLGANRRSSARSDHGGDGRGDAIK